MYNWPILCNILIYLFKDLRGLLLGNATLAPFFALVMLSWILETFDAILKLFEQKNE